MRRPHRWLLGTAMVVLVGLPACGEAQERDLCRRWEDLQAAAAQVQELDPATDTAEDLDAVANDVLERLEQFQATSEGLYDLAVSDLRAALTAIRQAAIDAGGEELEAARDLLQESWEDTVIAYQVLAQRLDVACGTTVPTD
jgi:hypothetical protein